MQPPFRPAAGRKLGAAGPSRRLELHIGYPTPQAHLPLSMFAQLARILQPVGGWNGTGPSLLAWALGLAILQSWGQGTDRDWADFLALAFVAAGVWGTGAWHRARPLPWVADLTVLARRLRRKWWPQRPSLGLDFRREPPVPSGIPRVYWIAPLASLVLLTVALMGSAPLGWEGAGHWPQGPRAWGTGGPYLAYLAYIGVLWGLAVGLGFFALSLTFSTLHEYFLARRRSGKDTDNRTELRAHLVLVLDLIICIGFLPIGLAMGILVGTGALNVLLCLWPKPEPKIFLWRMEHGQMRALHGRTRYLLLGAWPFALCAGLVLLLRGSWLGPARGLEGMPLSGWLASFCAWACATASLTMLVKQWLALHWNRRFHPARSPHPVIHVQGLLTDQERKQTRRILGQQGLGVQFSGKARADHIPVRIPFEEQGKAQSDDAANDAASPAAKEKPKTWPLAMSLEQLHKGEFRMLLLRRWQLQCRRLVLRGLQRLFKQAARHKAKPGEGFWIGIHHACVPGLIRDQDENEEAPTEEAGRFDEELIGSPYHELFPPVVRRQFYRMARDLQVDLIFVAKGVQFSGVRSVFQTLFEVHDIFGGEEPIGEHHFAGLHKVRVLVQEVEGSGGLRAKALREPDFTEIGRARVLLVLPNRGGGGERLRVPQKGDLVPAGF